MSVPDIKNLGLSILPVSALYKFHFTTMCSGLWLQYLELIQQDPGIVHYS